MTTTKLYEERVKRVNDAIALSEPDFIPIVPTFNSLPYCLSKDATFRDSMYNHPKAVKAFIEFAKDFKPDALNGLGMYSGKANEIAGTKLIDWPGKPGTTVDDSSTYQIIEHELLLQNEYPELLRDFTGFMLRKFIPRAYPALSGTASINFQPMFGILKTADIDSLYTPSILETYEKLKEISRYENQTAEANHALNNTLDTIGFPQYAQILSHAPYDILSNYFRGTLGTFSDLRKCPDMIAKACDLFADQIIETMSYFSKSDIPVKRALIPLHKGMDGFMSAKQYQTLYWEPLRKTIIAMIEMGITPILYTEGAYNTRLETLTDVPKGKVIYHFETIDMERAKKLLGNIACITGNFPLYLLEHGTKQQVADETKRLIDICAPGGGYMLDTNASVSNVKRENLEALFETGRIYGKR